MFAVTSGAVIDEYPSLTYPFAYSRADESRSTVCLVLAACGPSARSGDDDNGATSDANTSHQPDAGECKEVIDVVFVLDTSSSMDFVLTKLQQQIADVVTASNMVAADSHFGLIAFQDNYKLDDTGSLAR